MNKSISQRMKLISLVLILTLFNAVAQIFFKKGSNYIVFSSPLSFFMSVFFNFDVFIALLIYGISSLFLIFSLRMGDLSFVYPLLGATYVWVDLIAFFYFGEFFGIKIFFGNVLIIIGIVLLGSGSHDHKMRDAL